MAAQAEDSQATPEDKTMVATPEDKVMAVQAEDS